MEYKMLGVLMYRRSEEGRRLRRESMKNGKDYTPFQAKQPYLRADGIMNTLTLALTKDNLIVLVIPKSTVTQLKYMKNNLGEISVEQKFVMGIGNPRKGMESQKHLSRAWSQPKRVYDPSGIAPTISAQETQGRYHIVDQKTMATSPKSTQKNSQTSTVSLADSLARHFLSQGSEKDLRTQEGHSSLTLREYCEQNNLCMECLKTSKD